MEKHFESELSGLRNLLIDMATRAEEAVHEAIKGFLFRDIEASRLVIENDSKINDAEMTIDREIFRIEALAKPVAGDLRFLFAAEKINKDIERIGDHAVNIAQATIKVAGHDPFGTVPYPSILETMATITRRMLSDTVSCFVDGDSQQALKVLEDDDQVDELNDRMEETVARMIRENVETVEVGLVLTYVSRNLERIADLSTNIAEDVIFQAKATDVKHHHFEGLDG